MRLPVILEQVKGTFDVRHLLGIKARFVIITGKTDDTVNSLAEDVACFEQQETETPNTKYINKLLLFAPREVIIECQTFESRYYFIDFVFYRMDRICATDSNDPHSCSGACCDSG